MEAGVQELSVEQAAKLLQEYDQWLAEHFNELIEQYPGKIVAIDHNQVVAVGTTHKEIYDQFKEPEGGWMPLVVEVPYPNEPQGFIL